MKSMIMTIFITIITLIILWSMSCASSLTKTDLSNIANTNDTFNLQGSYKIHPFDKLQIVIIEKPELNGVYQINEAGEIVHPLFKYSAEGKTIGELTKELREVIKPYTRNALITISLSDPPNAYFYISGEIRNPGKYGLNTKTWLGHAIAIAGGLTDYSSKEIILIREKNERMHRYVIDYQQLINGDRTASMDQIFIERNDHIYVK